MWRVANSKHNLGCFLPIKRHYPQRISKSHFWTENPMSWPLDDGDINKLLILKKLWGPRRSMISQPPKYKYGALPIELLGHKEKSMESLTDSATVYSEWKSDILLLNYRDLSWVQGYHSRMSYHVFDSQPAYIGVNYPRPKGRWASCFTGHALWEDITGISQTTKTYSVSTCFSSLRSIGTKHWYYLCFSFYLLLFLSAVSHDLKVVSFRGLFQ